MKSANEVNAEIIGIAEGVINGTVDIQKATAVCNLYGRVNSIAIAQLRYAAQTKQNVEIDFFQKDVKKNGNPA